MIPLSKMNALIDYQMSRKLDENLEEREKTIAEEQQEIMESLEARVQEAVSTLQSLHQQLKSVSPNADMLADSSALLKENKEKLSSILTDAKVHLQNEKEHSEQLRKKLTYLEHVKKIDNDPISGVIHEIRDRVIKSIGDHS